MLKREMHLLPLPDCLKRFVSATLRTMNASLNRLFAPIENWQAVATDVRGWSLPCGHYLAEEQPKATLKALSEFFAVAGAA